MGNKIFVSYKYRDSNVKALNNNPNTIVRDYVDELENIIDKTDNIYKGEEDNEDLSALEDDTIWEKLKDRIYDSSLTIVLISPNMRDTNLSDRNQWIPWEISYSLKETSRMDKSGTAVTSKTNAMIAIVLPDRNGSYEYYLQEKNCCQSGCLMHKTNTLFRIIKENKFNYKNGNKRKCLNGSDIWSGKSSYIEAVKWERFIGNVKGYISDAYDRQEHIDDYEDLRKEV